MKRKELDQVYVGLQNSFFGKVDPRKRQEIKDSRMIFEDPTAIGNAPEGVIYHEFNARKYQEHLTENGYLVEDDRHGEE